MDRSHRSLKVATRVRIPLGVLAVKPQVGAAIWSLTWGFFVSGGHVVVSGSYHAVQPVMWRGAQNCARFVLTDAALIQRPRVPAGRRVRTSLACALVPTRVVGEQSGDDVRRPAVRSEEASNRRLSTRRADYLKHQLRPVVVPDGKPPRRLRVGRDVADREIETDPRIDARWLKPPPDPMAVGVERRPRP
jgi:hypothetical protein